MPTTNAPSQRVSPPDDRDDWLLMTAIRAGDASALGRFYDRHAPFILALCLRALHDRAEAEDLTLDVFWEIWNARERYDPARSNPLTYLLRLARCRIIDRMRAYRSGSKARLPSIADIDGQQAAQRDVALSAAETVVQAEQQTRVTRALNRLSAEQRTAVELSFFDALSHAEIAERLGEPLGTVKSRIRQALIRLRGLLSGA